MWTDVKALDFTYITMGLVPERSILTPEMAELCGDFPVVRIGLDNEQTEIKSQAIEYGQGEPKVVSRDVGY